MSGRRPMRVALTGGIATGKSVCLERLAALGAATLDADVLARSVVARGTPGLDAVVARFGSRVLQADGALDRTALGRIVFADADARRDLEAIIHPAVYEAVDAWFDELAQSAHAPHAGVVAIPLLFETGREKDFDRIVVAACRADQQLARLMARDGISEDVARQRVAAQWPLEEKVRRADVVIDTSGTIAETIASTDTVWSALGSA